MAELLVTTIVLAIVLAAVNAVFFSSNDMYARSNNRAGAQMNSRLGMSIFSQEIRHAGCDPTGMGVTPILTAAQDTLRLNADLDGDGAIETVEPSEDITYFYDPLQQAVFRDPGTGPQLIVPNVSALILVYLDAANQPLAPLPLTPAQADRVNSVLVQMTTEAEGAGEVTLTTTITLRN